MGLITKTVKVKWHYLNREHYESLGYKFTKNLDEFEVKVEELPTTCKIVVDYICDGCGKIKHVSYGDYTKKIKEDGKTYCKKCVNKHHNERIIKGLLKNSNSFYDWCIEHNRQDVLNRWDYELNDCTPFDISYGANKKYYFKCNEHPEHESELKKINCFTSGKEGSIACNQCNSIAQYILNNFPNKDLYDVWDKKRNGIVNPWKISKGSNLKKYWFICQEKEYHGSYEMTCNALTKGSRCPYCAGKKIHAKDSIRQYIIDNYGEKFLHGVWSDENNVSPFELSKQSNKKVWWKCSEGKHEDYFRNCKDSFICEFRCPKCVEEMSGSVIEEKTKTYLVYLGYKVLTEHECTIRPINPKTKMPMPYDNEIMLSNNKHLIVEVHGEQHYIERTGYFKGKLKQRKLYDRYKKAYAEHYGYCYLEIPYTAFDKNETYKQMIDEKIEEILHNTKAS